MNYENPLGYAGGGWIENVRNRLQGYGKPRQETAPAPTQPAQPAPDTSYKQSSAYKDIFSPEAYAQDAAYKQSLQGYAGGGWIENVRNRLQGYGQPRQELTPPQPVQPVQPAPDNSYKQSSAYKDIFSPEAYAQDEAHRQSIYGYALGGPVAPMRQDVWDARQGGPVPVGPKGVDTVPAMSSQGVVALDSQPKAKEYVLTRPMVNKLGGEKRLENMRRQLSNRGSVSQRRMSDGTGSY